MKKIISVLIISLFVISLSAQNKVDKVFLSKTIKVENTTKAELLERANYWLALDFRNTNQVVVERIREDDFFGGNVEVTLKTLSSTLNFKILIKVADNEYTYEVSNVNQQSTNKILAEYFVNLGLDIEKGMLKESSSRR